MTDALKVFFGVELVIAVLAFLGGGPFGWPDIVKVFVGINIVVAVLMIAVFLIGSGVGQ